MIGLIKNDKVLLSGLQRSEEPPSKTVQTNYSLKNRYIKTVAEISSLQYVGVEQIPKSINSPNNLNRINMHYDLPGHAMVIACFKDAATWKELI